MDTSSVFSSTFRAASAPALVVICGPTAAGKSGLAMAIAQRLQTVIISADSRQVYREFDIGTAKPSPTDLQTVPHFMIDCCEPTDTLTLADYQTQVQSLIQCCHRQDDPTSSESKSLTLAAMEEPPGAAIDSTVQLPVAIAPKIPLLVGGTGLYIKSIVRGLKIPRVPPNADLRSQLEALGQPQCYGFLQQVDRGSAARIHPNDQVRTLRALEVYYTTGIPMTAQQGESPPPYPVLQLGVDCFEEDGLSRRIEHRTRHMVAQGLVDEVAGLCDRHGTDLPLLDTLGYREMRQYLAGDGSLEEAIAQTIVHTRQFAKRQRTWFRADPSIEWLEATDPDLVDRAWEKIQQFLLALNASR
ncbi:MAG: tRNA (adenosine(37)-N6)-dimethylallyltransferase MiaA [Elainellaceae cyanobacterium]